MLRLSRRGSSVVEKLIVLNLVCMVVALIFACANFKSAIVKPAAGMFMGDEDARLLLEGSGYTNLELIDEDVFFVDWRGCGLSDYVKFEYEATNAKGVRGEVGACCGLTKNCAIGM